MYGFNVIDKKVELRSFFASEKTMQIKSTFQAKIRTLERTRDFAWIILNHVVEEKFSKLRYVVLYILIIHIIIKDFLSQVNIKVDPRREGGF